MSNYQRIVIRFEDYTDREGLNVTESVYQQQEISLDDLFWSWFIPSWAAMGLPSITRELKAN